MWIESHTNLARHPKTRRLMKLLGWSLPDTIGNLHLLWWWALDFAPTGDLSRYTPEELTADLDLLGSSPEQFIGAMVAAGFLDKIGFGSAESRHDGNELLIHDWQEYKRPKPRRPRSQATQPPPITAALNPKSAEQGVARSDIDKGAPAPEQSAPTCAVREPKLVEHEPPGADRIDCAEDTARQGGASGGERNQMALRAVPNVSQTDPVAPTGTVSNKETFQHDAVTEDAAIPAPRTAEEDIELRKAFPAIPESRALPSEPSRPAVAGHNPQLVAPHRRGWWPLYIDFHKKAGTPLTKDAQAKFLAQLAEEPLSAVEQIKVAITHSVRSGILEHAP